MSRQVELAKEGGMAPRMDPFYRKSSMTAYEYRGHVIALHEWPWGEWWIDIWKDGERVGETLKYCKPRGAEMLLAERIVDARVEVKGG